jgi:hypothetical protein
MWRDDKFLGKKAVSVLCLNRYRMQACQVAVAIIAEDVTLDLDSPDAVRVNRS